MSLFKRIFGGGRPMDLSELAKAISTSQLLGPPLFDDLDLDPVLQGRDEDSLGRAWVDSFEVIGKHPFDVEQTALIDAVREAAFKAVYRGCEDSDLAGYVSDDFELIAKALLLRASDPFVNALWQSYQRNEIPSGSISPIPGRIDRL